MVAIGGLCAIGLCRPLFHLCTLALGINIALTAIVFYGVGYLTKEHLNKVLDGNKFLLVGFALVLFGVMTVIAMRNGVPDMNARIYNNYTLFIIGAFSGTIALLLASRFAELSLKNLRYFEFFSVNTLAILGFHKILGELIKGVLELVFKIPGTVLNGFLIYSFGLSIAQMLLMIPLILFINAYCPIIVGRRSLSVRKS